LGPTATCCPYSEGQKLWVRETHAREPGTLDCLWYTADFEDATAAGQSMGLRWVPSIQMPRAASRITLEVTEVSVERLQAISEVDAQADGVERDRSPCVRATHMRGDRLSRLDVQIIVPRPVAQPQRHRIVDGQSVGVWGEFRRVQL
jgi:hypothetical protein